MLLKSLKLRYAGLYAGLLILSFVILFLISYGLLNASLRREERIQIQARLLEFWSIYESGGMRALQRDIIVEKSLEYGRPFILRVASFFNTTLFIYVPDQWRRVTFTELSYIDPFEEQGLIRISMGNQAGLLQIASLRLPDGNILQIGFHSDSLQEILNPYRWAFALVAIPLIVLSFLGGLLFSKRALMPLQRLGASIQSILDTGRLKARVSSSEEGDELNQLVRLYNRMLDKVESLMTAMRESLDNVAHDVRTPLTRIRGTAELALAPTADQETRLEALTTCVEETKRVLILLETLMDISAAETGVMNLDKSDGDLTELVGDMIDLHSYAAAEKNITINKQLSPSLRTDFDLNRLRQAISNLLDNALKYTPEGGQITITAQPEPDRAVIRVEDSGRGIDAKELPRIWDRLYRGDRSRTESGLGLGLSMVKAIVEAHGGTVSAVSTPGQGSTFTLTFPA